MQVGQKPYLPQPTPPSSSKPTFRTELHVQEKEEASFGKVRTFWYFPLKLSTQTFGLPDAFRGSPHQKVHEGNTHFWVLEKTQCQCLNGDVDVTVSNIFYQVLRCSIWRWALLRNSHLYVSPGVNNDILMLNSSQPFRAKWPLTRNSPWRPVPAAAESWLQSSPPSFSGASPKLLFQRQGQRPPRSQPEVWSDAGGVSAQEIMDLQGLILSPLGLQNWH